MRTSKDSKYLYVHDEKNTLKSTDMKDLGGTYVGECKWRFSLSLEDAVMSSLGDLHIQSDNNTTSGDDSDPDYLSPYGSSSEELDESEIPDAVVRVLKQRRCKHKLHREDSQEHSSDDEEEGADDGKKCSNDKGDCLDPDFKRKRYTGEDLLKERERLRALAAKLSGKN